MTTLHVPTQQAKSRGRIVRMTWSRPTPAPHEFAAIAYPEDEGGYSVHAVHYPGVFSQGDTIEEARANIGEAFLALLEARRQHGETMEYSGRPLISVTPDCKRLWIAANG